MKPTLLLETGCTSLWVIARKSELTQLSSWMDMGSAQGDGIDRLPKDQQRQIPSSWVVPRCLIGVLSLRQFLHFSYRGINTVGSVGNCHRNCFCVFVFVALRSLHHYQSFRKYSICWVCGQLRPKQYLYELIPLYRHQGWNKRLKEENICICICVGGYSPIVNRSPQELGLPKFGQPPFGLT